MTCHYPLLGSASYWLKQSSLAAQPANQYGISALVSQGRHFASGGVAKCRLFFSGYCSFPRPTETNVYLLLHLGPTH